MKMIIWKRLTKAPVKEARLIGDILGLYPVSIGDWWYTKRIDNFIAQGKIKIIEDSEKIQDLFVWHSCFDTIKFRFYEIDKLEFDGGTESEKSLSSL